MSATEAPNESPRVTVDCTHMGRRASGIERITDQLFSKSALAPLQVSAATSSGRRLSMIMRQMVRNPLMASIQPGMVWAFPGYPPSPFFALMRERTVLYVHDLFLVTRAEDLNRAAKYYMSYPFRLALRNLRYFFVNSTTTGRQLAAHVAQDATIQRYRPCVANVFSLEHRPRLPVNMERPLIVGAVGTIEPRKNFPTAARICRALSERLSRPVELHVIGRNGWGPDHDLLAASSGVRLHGYLPDEAIRPVIERFDVVLCTSHDEGLGLPLLEMQYAGLPVIAPDAEIFHEVLGESGTFINTSDADLSAAIIGGLVTSNGQLARAAALARANVERWNAQAAQDRAAVVDLLIRLSEAARGCRMQRAKAA